MSRDRVFGDIIVKMGELNRHLSIVVALSVQREREKDA
jgi:hypothetical protein